MNPIKCPLCRQMVTPDEIVEVQIPIVVNGRRRRRKMPARLTECCSTIFIDATSKKISQRGGLRERVSGLESE